jgi:hypothetical protein
MHDSLQMMLLMATKDAQRLTTSKQRHPKMAKKKTAQKIRPKMKRSQKKKTLSILTKKLSQILMTLKAS